MAPIFQWTYKKYVEEVQTIDGFEHSGHMKELEVGGHPHAMPDQVQIQGPFSECESAGSAKVEIISSKQQARTATSWSREGGASMKADVGLKVPPATVKTTVENSLS